MVKAFPRALEPAFSFQPVEELEVHDIDVAIDDVLHNLVTKESQLMNGSTPWRGAREKYPLLMQMLIKSTTSFGDLVLDYTASMGKSYKFQIVFKFKDLLYFFTHTTFHLLTMSLSLPTDVVGTRFVVNTPLRHSKAIKHLKSDSSIVLGIL